MSFQIPKKHDRVMFVEGYNYDRVGKGATGTVRAVNEGMSGSGAARIGESKLITVELDKGGTTEVFEKRIKIIEKQALWCEPADVGDTVTFLEDYGYSVREGATGVVTKRRPSESSKLGYMLTVQLDNGSTTCFAERVAVVVKTPACQLVWLT